ncbi:hypothetical protein IWQ57_004337 [Coemansia nantahalensis]|uniref:Uncharacterized protein n=1 Tax=Coemansia nantahalensis TaxID=2789366 RepID=A0ACC1JSX5_9FUNG|nr:hypothetical protein IWQ57_004337 [Coemansia nantahalensis]
MAVVRHAIEPVHYMAGPQHPPMRNEQVAMDEGETQPHHEAPHIQESLHIVEFAPAAPARHPPNVEAPARAMPPKAPQQAVENVVLRPEMLVPQIVLQDIVGPNAGPQPMDSEDQPAAPAPAPASSSTAIPATLAAVPTTPAAPASSSMASPVAPASSSAASPAVHASSSSAAPAAVSAEATEMLFTGTADVDIASPLTMITATATATATVSVAVPEAAPDMLAEDTVSSLMTVASAAIATTASEVALSASISSNISPASAAAATVAPPPAQAAVQAIKMTTVGHAVVPFDVNLFGTDGAPFPGVVLQSESLPATVAEPASAAASTSIPIAAPAAATSAVVEETAEVATADSIVTVTQVSQVTQVSPAAGSSSSISASAAAPAVAAERATGSPVLAEEATAFRAWPTKSVSLLTQSPHPAKAPLVRLSNQDTAKALGISDTKDPASKIAHAGMKNKATSDASAAPAPLQFAAALLVPAVVGLLF